MSVEPTGRSVLFGLGLRLNTSARGQWPALAVAAAGVALATSLLLLALAIGPALEEREARARWRTAFAEPASYSKAEADALRWRSDFEWYLGREIARVEVAALGPDAPVPPGLESIPAPGEAYVSPALAALLAEAPDDELDARYGRVVGTVGKQGLRGPNEAVAAVGVPADVLADRSPW
ncbi:MAG: hypothetical protein ACRD0A_15855, partial [Acidimicrobiales bacterium]